MSASLIGIIFTALIAFILVCSIFFGAKRGLKKTFFRFIWLFITAIAVYFLTPVFTNIINGIDISSLGLDINGPVTKISDIGVNLVNSLAESNEAFANSEALKTFAANVPAMILNIFVFVIAFWLLKALLYPLWAFISSRIFDKQERELKKFKKQQAKLRAQNNGVLPPQDENVPILLQVKQKKIRSGGAVVGVLMGLLLCAITLSPFVGLNAIYQNVSANVTVEENGKNVSVIEKSIDDEEMLGYLSSYEDSIGSKILTYSGMGFISNALFEGLATATVNNEKVHLGQEVNTIVKVYGRYYSIQNFDSENITKESLNNLLSTISKTFNDVRSSKLVYLLGDDILPHILDDVINAEDFKLIDDGGEIDDLIVSAYNAYSSNFKLIDLQSQVENIVNAVSALNNADLIVPFVKGEVSGLDGILLHLGKVGKNNNLDMCIDKLYNVSMLKNKYPELVDKGVKALFEALDITYKNQYSTTENLQQSLKDIVSNLLEFCDYYADSENLDFDKGSDAVTNTVPAFESLGKVFDVLKNILLSAENYKSLINFGVEKINELTADFADFSEITNDLKLVESWEEELKNIANIYSKVIKLVNSEITFEKVLDENYVEFENVGKGIQSSINLGSTIISNKNIRTILETILDKVDTTNFDEVLNVVVSGEKSLKNTLLDNIYNKTTQKTTILNWYDELKYNVNVFRKVYPIIVDNFDLNKLSAADNNQLANLGAAIDDALVDTKLILTNEVIRNIVDYYLQKVELGAEVDEILNIVYSENGGNPITVYDQVLNNIYDGSSNKTEVVWENEFAKIKNVLTAQFDTTNLPAMGAILDDISGSKLINSLVINKVVGKYIDDEINSLGSDLATGLADAVASLKLNLQYIISYEDEFTFLTGLVDVLSATYDNNTAMFTAIGEEFNKITNIQGSYDKRSNVITKTVVSKMISYYFDDYKKDNLTSTDADLLTAIDKIKDNLDDIENYKNELLNILKVADCLDGTIEDKNGDSVGDLKDTGRVLDEMVSHIITTEVIRNIITVYINNNIESITDENLIEIINDIKARVSDTDIVIASYETEFGCLDDLTKLISAETLNYTEIGKTFDRICNITGDENIRASVFISRHTLDDFLTYYIDKFATEKLASEQGLLDVVETIKEENISSIASYEAELTFVNSLFSVIGGETTAIGTQLDEIKDNSNLIKNKNINDIVLHYFDKEAGPYTGDGKEYKSIIALMRSKVEGLTNAEGKIYNALFTEFNSIIENIAEFEVLTDATDFTNPENIGSRLDAMENMQYACDKAITYECSKIIIQKLSSDAIAQAKVEAVLTSEIFDYNNYNTPDYVDEYPGENYYTDLFTAIKTAFDTP